MVFGRVEAVAVEPQQPGESGQIRITVYLETGRDVKIVRDELVSPLAPVAGPADLAWHADQYAQETIANELALEGWEVIGGGEMPANEPGSVAKSATYAVRRLGLAWNE